MTNYTTDIRRTKNSDNYKTDTTVVLYLGLGTGGGVVAGPGDRRWCCGWAWGQVMVLCRAWGQVVVLWLGLGTGGGVVPGPGDRRWCCEWAWGQAVVLWHRWWCWSTQGPGALEVLPTAAAQNGPARQPCPAVILDMVV